MVDVWKPSSMACTCNYPFLLTHSSCNDLICVSSAITRHRKHHHRKEAIFAPPLQSRIRNYTRITCHVKVKFSHLPFSSITDLNNWLSPTISASCPLSCPSRGAVCSGPGSTRCTAAWRSRGRWAEPREGQYKSCQLMPLTSADGDGRIIMGLTWGWRGWVWGSFGANIR